jgi:6-phosphogluconolactonase/glucosamine-6-phosphate isomerase/deaminase
MLVVIKDSYVELSRIAARIVANAIGKKPRLTLGLAAGSTPLGMYQELIRLHREEGCLVRGAHPGRRHRSADLGIGINGHIG